MYLSKSVLIIFENISLRDT